jgi:DUF2075 family protein
MGGQAGRHALSQRRSLPHPAPVQRSEADLLSQFRCNGSDGYLTWLDDALGIKPAEEPVADLDYDFRVFDDPNALFEAIAEKNAASGKSRVVAGYCWEWDSDKRSNPNHHDIVLPDHDFRKSWNLASTATWAVDDNSLDQIGCVHTAQGLEFDWVGVIIGDDLRFEDDRLFTDHTKRAKSDASLKGIKSLAKSDPSRAHRIADEIIRNTYRVLMTRGMRGCYAFCTDPGVADYLRSRQPSSTIPAPYSARPRQLPLIAESVED